MTPAPSLWGMTRGVGHPGAEGVLPLLQVARVDAGGGDADADLARAGLRVRHLAADQDVTGRPLPLVPGCSHRLAGYGRCGRAPEPW
jgi:hypothetical protein